ncbi:uncharacterized protein TNCV_4832171 [Trichonephila clavipes]|nr:uncharacterized protein TNCV_4832171 [Trichonephila clavipes]
MEALASGSIFNFYERPVTAPPPLQAELLSSRLQQWNLLLPGIKVTEHRTREKNLLHFFEKKEHAVACIDVNVLMNFMSISYNPYNWRLLKDSSKLSLKAVLLHNDNLLPSIPIGHSVHVKETYANVKLLLKLIKYEDHKWHICGDLKVIALLMDKVLLCFCVCGTVEIESRTTYNTNGCPEI